MLAGVIAHNAIRRRRLQDMRRSEERRRRTREDERRRRRLVSNRDGEMRNIDLALLEAMLALEDAAMRAETLQDDERRFIEGIEAELAHDTDHDDEGEGEEEDDDDDESEDDLDDISRWQWHSRSSHAEASAMDSIVAATTTPPHIDPMDECIPVASALPVAVEVPKRMGIPASTVAVEQRRSQVCSIQ